MGWMPPGQIVDVPANGTQTIVLSPLRADPQFAVFPQVLKIARPGEDTDYYLSYRTQAGYDSALRDIYVAKVADRTGVRRETLEAELKRAGSTSSRARREAPTPPRQPDRPRMPRSGAERKLLLVMVRGVEWVERAAELVSSQDFEDPYHRAIFQALLDDPERRTPPASMDPVAAQRFEEILSDPEEITHGIDVFTNSVNRIRVLALDRRIQDLQRQIEAAIGDEKKLELTRTKAGLAAELRELDPNYWGSATRGPRGEDHPNEDSR